ncbi:MAG: tetratricopeptide repeat protein [Planctomycetota bacterium]
MKPFKIHAISAIIILSVLVGCAATGNTPPPVIKTDKTVSAESQSHYRKGRELILQNKSEEAVKEFKQAIALSPDYLEAHQEYIDAMRYMDKQSEVREEYKVSLGTHKEMALAHYLYAKTLPDKDLEQLKIQCEEALKIDPLFYPAYSMLSKYYDELKDYDKAIASAQKAIEINPGYVWGYLMLAQTYQSQNELDKVVKNYEKALELDPDDTGRQSNLALAYFWIGEMDKGFNLIRLILEKDKRPLVRVVIYNNRAMAYARMGNRSGALDDLDKAIAIGRSGKSASMLFMAADTLAQIKEYGKALEILEQALKYNPDEVLSGQINALIKQMSVAKGQASGTDMAQPVYQELENAEREMLVRIMALPDEQINLAEASLTLAKKIYPDLDIAKYLKHIDSMATELKAKIGNETEPARIISAVNAYLYKDASMAVELTLTEKGASITTMRSLYEEGNYWLNEVLDAKQGSCFGFTVLYLAMAERLKLPVYGVTLPEHIFLRYDDGKTRINIEPVGAGKQISDSDYCSGKVSPDIVISEKGQAYYLKNITKKDVIKALVFQRGLSYLSNNMPDKAMDDVKKLLEIDPQYSRAYLLQGGIAVVNNNPDKALDCCAQAIKVNPLLGEAYCSRAGIYWKTKQWEKAVEESTRAIEIFPSAKYYALRAFAYAKNGQIDEGFKDANKVIETWPKSPYGYQARGWVYNSIKEYAKALTDFQQYLKLVPDEPDGEVLYAIAWYYGKGQGGVDKDIKEAIKWLNKAAEQGQVSAYCALAQLYYEGQDIPQNISEAVKCLNKALEQGYQPAKEALEKIQAETASFEEVKKSADDKDASLPNYLVDILNSEDKDIDLAKTALLIAKDVYPDVDIDKYLKKIDAMVSELKSKIAKDKSPMEIVGIINDYIFKEKGYQIAHQKGPSSDLLQPTKFFLNQIIDAQNNNACVSKNSIVLLYLILSERLGFPICYITLPYLAKPILLEYDDGCSQKFMVIIETPKDIHFDTSNKDLKEKYKGVLKISEQAIKRGVYLSNGSKKKLISSSLVFVSVCYFKQVKLTEAFKNLDYALKLDPLNLFAYMLRTAIYGFRKKYVEASSELDKLKELDPNEVVVYYIEASIYAEKKEMDKAIAVITKGIENGVDCVVLYDLRGRLLLTKEDYTRALDDFNKVIELAPSQMDIIEFGTSDLCESYCCRGKIFAELNEGAKAIADMEEAIKVFAENSYPYECLALIYDHLEKHGKAAKYAKEAIKLGAENDKLSKIASFTDETASNPAYEHFSSGQDYHKKREFDKAITEYSEAIKIDAKFAKAYYYRANAYASNKDYKAAIEDGEMFLKLAPDDPKAKDMELLVEEWKNKVK